MIHTEDPLVKAIKGLTIAVPGITDRPKPPKSIQGHTKPRIAPPLPARSGVREFVATAKAMGLVLMPWQEYGARYLTATGRYGLLYREVCIVVARQQGKTSLMKPLIVQALRAGEKIMHIAQNRELPRQMFAMIADALSAEPDLFPKRRGRVIWPRFGAGQEEIVLLNGGSYRIAASTTGGTRGWPNDKVIIDELREMKDNSVIGAIEPTLTMSSRAQMIYLSNAGTEQSVILNDLRKRGLSGEDPNLAYLEWSAEPDRDFGDIAGWAQANPALGYYPSVQRTLEAAYLKHKAAGTLNLFNIEHLCRWEESDLPSLVEQPVWDASRAADLGKPKSPVLGVSLDPSGKRASIALAWQDADGIAVRLIGDVTGDPIDADLLGQEVKAHAQRLGVMIAGYDPETDALLAKYLRKPETVVGAKWTAACSRFATLAESGKLRWEGPDAMSEDNRWAARLTDPADGTFRVVKAKDDHPITSILAAIRAVWLASGPPRIRPKVM